MISTSNVSVDVTLLTGRCAKERKLSESRKLYRNCAVGGITRFILNNVSATRKNMRNKQVLPCSQLEHGGCTLRQFFEAQLKEMIFGRYRGVAQTNGSA